MQSGIKRPHSTKKGGNSSRPNKRNKNVDPDSPEELAKEMSVGFGLDSIGILLIPFLN